MWKPLSNADVVSSLFIHGWILNFQQIMNKTYHNLLPIGFASTPLRVTLVPMRELLFAISIKLVHSIRNAHTHAYTYTLAIQSI